MRHITKTVFTKVQLALETSGIDYHAFKKIKIMEKSCFDCNKENLYICKAFFSYLAEATGIL